MRRRAIWVMVPAACVIMVAFAGATFAATTVHLNTPSDSDITSSSVKLQWSQTQDWLFTRYEVWKNESTEWKIVTQITDASTTTYTVTGLTSNHKYQFKIVDVDSISSAESNIISVTTKAQSSQPPTKPVARLIGTTSGYVNDVFSFDGSSSTGDIRYYYFEFGDGQDSGWISSSTTTHKYTSTGSYYVKLKVKDKSDQTSSSTTLSINVKAKSSSSSSTGSSPSKGFIPGFELIVIIFGIGLSILIRIQKEKMK